MQTLESRMWLAISPCRVLILRPASEWSVPAAWSVVQEQGSLFGACSLYRSILLRLCCIFAQVSAALVLEMCSSQQRKRVPKIHFLLWSSLGQYWRERGYHRPRSLVSLTSSRLFRHFAAVLSYALRRCGVNAFDRDD